MLTADNLGKKYGEEVVLDNVSFTLDREETLAVVPAFTAQAALV